MNLTDLKIFLTIANTRNISKASNILFISQPTISHRLKLLETELNVPLFVRNKGLKQIELTNAGEEFLPIAERIESIWKETRFLQQHQSRTLFSIGCTDSMNVAILSRLYKGLMGEGSIFNIKISTHQSVELYGLLDAHDIDVAFVNYDLYYKNIVCEPILQEKLYLVQSCNPAVPKPLVHTEELDPAKELFQKWDEPYQLWHDQWLSNFSKPAISVDTFSLLSRLWDEKEQYWVIAPESVICELNQVHSIYVSELQNAPPDRCYYIIKHRYPLPTSQRVLDQFETRLHEYIAGLKYDIRVGEMPLAAK